MRLFHVSENPDIAKFEPRPAPTAGWRLDYDVVWAVDEWHLPHYLLPRDCPRVCIFADEKTTEADKSYFFGASDVGRVIAIEAAWLQRVLDAKLFLYQLPNESFVSQDENAGYWTSKETVEPLGKIVVDNVFEALSGKGIEVRILPSLWGLRESVIDSSLGFSIIRFRNAANAPAGFETKYKVAR